MRIYCLGDSNTYGYDPCSYFGGRYPANSRWPDLLAAKIGCQVINAGENGREIPRREYEFCQCRQISSADFLIIMLGTNDLLQGASMDTIEGRMEAFLKQLTIPKKNILLVAPPPLQLGAWVTEKSLVHASEQFALIYQRLSTKLGIRFADAANWDVRLTFDGVHFSEEGHKAFAAGIGKEIIR